MERVLQHIFEQPMERGVQTCIKENTKYGNADYATKTGRHKNSKYTRNNEVYNRTTHSRRQCPRRHTTSQEHQKTSRTTVGNYMLRRPKHSKIEVVATKEEEEEEEGEEEEEEGEEDEE